MLQCLLPLMYAKPSRMSVLTPFTSSSEEEVVKNQRPQDQEHNQPSELLQEMDSELEESRMSPQSQLTLPESLVVEEVEDSEQAKSLFPFCKVYHSFPWSKDLMVEF